MVLTRRSALSLSGTALCSVLAGCVSGAERGGADQTSTPPFFEDDAEVRLEEKEDVTPTDPVLFEELSPGEQSIAVEAIQKGVYHECESAEADTIKSLNGRFGSRSPYLRYQNENYGVWIRIADVVEISTASPPEESVSKSCND